MRIHCVQPEMPLRTGSWRAVRPAKPFALLRKLLLSIQSWAAITSLLIGCALTAGYCAESGPVTLSEDSASFTLANGIVTAKIKKQSGDLISLRYRNKETLGSGSGHPYGYWSHAPDRSAHISNSIAINPSSNGGERAEVSVKGVYQGTPLGSGPGGSANTDIEIRYALGRGDSGLYTYSIFDHKPDYPRASIGEARFGAKLNDQIFDYMTIDANRRKVMITAEDWNKGTQLDMKEARRMNTGKYIGQVEHKYDYSAIQFDTPAFGWSSSAEHIGFWFINPTIEYLSGGATKVELTAHRDVNEGAAPTMLNYWRGSHYGGSACDIAQGEAWTKIIGPFLIYCNTAPTHEAMWKDALSQATKEAKKWPYPWVSGVDYPLKQQRGTVNGQIILSDAQAPGIRMHNLLVGLAAPDSAASAGRAGGWQMDAKHYQFWVRGDAEGRFTIPNVRPGSYNLHAVADGVLGEYSQANITVEPGKTLDLGRLEWKPVRYGKQVWEIGIPNRSAEEFRHGSDYWHWGLYLKYADEFPNDVNYIVGKSDYRTDWNYCQPPHADGKGSTWTITFSLPAALTGKATLRLALAATSAKNIQVTVNDQPAGETGALPDTATIRRDGIRGYWFEKDISFDAALMRQGQNVIKLTIPPGGIMSGVEYDYLRLEVAP